MARYQRIQGGVCVVWCGGLWCGVVGCGVVWCGGLGWVVGWWGVGGVVGVWCGVVGCGVVWWGVVWCGVPRASCRPATRGACSPPCCRPAGPRPCKTAPSYNGVGVA